MKLLLGRLALKVNLHGFYPCCRYGMVFRIHMENKASKNRSLGRLESVLGASFLT